MSKAFQRRFYLLASLLVLAVAPAFAQTGGQPLRLIVGYAAGGPVDAAARQFAPYLGRELGQSVVVENRPGVAGALGADAVAKSPPTAPLLYFGASPTLTITPHVVKSLPLDPSRDLAPVAPILAYANVLVVNKEAPFSSIKELVAYARANPGKVTYGSAGMGASNHLSGELLAMRTDIKLSHVPYKGNAPAMTDVIGGQITMMFDIISTARNYIASGRVRPLAVTSAHRNPSLPDVPTMQEAGIRDYDVGGWYGLFGPARMAPELIDRYSRATRAALANEELKQKLVEAGYDLWTGTPQMLAERQARELALWATVTRNIKFE